MLPGRLYGDDESPYRTSARPPPPQGSRRSSRDPRPGAGAGLRVERGTARVHHSPPGARRTGHARPPPATATQRSPPPRPVLVARRQPHRAVLSGAAAASARLAWPIESRETRRRPRTGATATVGDPTRCAGLFSARRWPNAGAASRDPARSPGSTPRVDDQARGRFRCSSLLVIPAAGTACRRRLPCRQAPASTGRGATRSSAPVHAGAVSAPRPAPPSCPARPTPRRRWSLPESATWPTDATERCSTPRTPTRAAWRLPPSAD